MPALGRSGSLDMLLAAYSLVATLWQTPTRQSGSPMSTQRARKSFRPSGIWASRPP
ncbi:hypothetical protein MOKP45_41260 [Mycobacterium avium subsp. hominissuis]